MNKAKASYVAMPSSHWQISEHPNTASFISSLYSGATTWM